MPLVEAPYVSAICAGNVADAKNLLEGGIDALKAFFAEATQDEDIEVVSSRWISLYK